jgi:hypothetical protein
MKAKNSFDNHDLPADLAAEWREEAIRRSQRPEAFWSSQEMRIRAHIRSQSARKPRPLWLATATAALIFLAVLLIAPARPNQLQTPVRATIDTDQELLLAVERALASGTPESLEPLTLLVESSSDHNEVEPITHKEHLNEN